MSLHIGYAWHACTCECGVNETALLWPQVAHTGSIDWLELNAKGTHLLFRDRRAALHLVTLATGVRTQLLQAASYAQWVPDSDVIVVRSHHPCDLPCCSGYMSN